MGADKGVAEGHERGGNLFLNFCFEMVHVGAKVSNAVHHHWFFGVYSETTDFNFWSQLGGG